MTTIAAPLAVPVVARPRLVSRPLLLVLLADVGGLTSFYLLLSPVPQHAMASGAAGSVAGLATGVLMLTSVAAEFLVPRSVGRFGSRAVLMAGLALLGLPALALLAAASLPVVLAVCFARGLGLAVIFVECGALAARLVPAERRGEGLGVLGVAAGLPAIVATPCGVWLLEHTSPALVFVVGAASALAGVAAAAALPADAVRGDDADSDADADHSVTGGLRNPALLRPAVVFAATATAAGIVVTFLPAVTAGSGNLVALALLLQAASATVARWWAGRHGDKHGAARLLVPGAVAAAAGTALLVAAGSPLPMLAGMLVFGAGFGVVQNASQAMMFERVPTSAYGTASAIWSVAYDTGYGVGALGFGLVAGATGYPVGFALTAAAMLVTLPLVTRPLARRRPR
jgi:predicted MFS family arabinose efflux permease